MDSDDRFISPQRRISQLPGGGVQYIPGHTEFFVDAVVDLVRRDQSMNTILEIGGGGLRFASAVAVISSVTDITVVEPDYASLDPIRALRDSTNSEAILQQMKHKCAFHVVSEKRFFHLLKADVYYDMVASFRVFHFLDEESWERVIDAVRAHLRPGGLFVFSGLSPMDQDTGAESLLYQGSQAIGDDPDYRKLNTASSKVERAVSIQNLPSMMRFFPVDTTVRRLQTAGFNLVDGPFRSTRIVHGFIFQKN